MINDKGYDEIVNFQTAVAKGNYKEAEKILQNTRHASPVQIISWTWQIKSKTNKVNLDELYDVILSENFPLGLLYIYFEKCLEHRDVRNFDRMYAIYPIKNFDKDSPIYFRVIENFLYDKNSNKNDKEIASMLHVTNDAEFIKYIKI